MKLRQPVMSRCQIQQGESTLADECIRMYTLRYDINAVCNGRRFFIT